MEEELFKKCRAKLRYYNKMRVLLPDNLSFELNQPTHKLIDAKMCVFDTRDKEYKDFFFKKITNYISYRYPNVELKIFDERDTFYITYH